MPTRRPRLLWLFLIPAALAAGFFVLRGRGEATQYTTGTVDRGDIVEVVGATGTLEAVTTVQIGSQVSGTIQSLYADFNSTVKKGQVIARLDPSILQARLGQAEASVLSARANVDRAQATVEDTRQKYERAKELAATKLIAETDLETAKANYDGAVAQLKSNQAAESQAVANLNQAKVDLSHTIIDTPIDGVVISRNVDVGQTVAASFQAPVLFVIANDLAQMRVNAAVDEADVGRVREGEDVVFHVDAFPDREFKGKVEQVRLNPTTVSNVVSYNTIVAVDNRDLLLRPGMTATVSIIVRKADNALRIPAAALRFRPEGYQRTGGTSRRSGAPGALEAPGGAATRADGGRPSGGLGGGRPGGPGGERPAGTATGAAEAAERGPAPAGTPGAAGGAGGHGRGRPTVVFVLDETGQPKPVNVRTDVSDGQFVELREGLDEGAVIITGTEIPGARAAGTGARPGASPSSNPFSPQRPQPRQR
jgi:HlyD family secretion protein